MGFKALTPYTAEYSTAHSRVKAQRGSASQNMCVDCRCQAREWSWRKGHDPFDVQSYDPRCVKCHRRYDEWAVKVRTPEILALQSASQFGSKQLNNTSGIVNVTRYADRYWVVKFQHKRKLVLGGYYKNIRAAWEVRNRIAGELGKSSVPFTPTSWAIERDEKIEAR